MKILLLLISIAGLAAFFLVMRYNLHMFQLNGYKSQEHVVWLCKNYRKQAILIVNGILGLITLIKYPLSVMIIICIVLIIILRYYFYLRGHNVKKKLVYTNRVKRLVFTNILLNFSIICIACFICGIEVFSKLLIILVSLQPIFLLLVNIVNNPVERIINNYYISDAKKKLKQVPNLIIIGVTGSYGKTSVKYYLQTLLKERFNVLITPESYNTPMGIVKTIRGSLKPTHEIFICEMGARHVGDIKEICDIVHPNHGIITSVGPQHLETFLTMENIVNTKFELADALDSDGILFLNGDNSFITGNSGKYRNKIFYSTHDLAGYYAEDVKLSQLGTEFTVISPNGEKESFLMKLIGEHNIINVVGAIAVANSLGISLNELKVPVRRIQSVEHRMQMIKRGDITIIDDAYNSNPISSKAAVETLAGFEGIRILITPGMVELGKEEEEYNFKFGTYAAKCCDYILLVGKQRAIPIEKGAAQAGFSHEKCKIFGSLEEALNYAYGIKEEGHKYILLENDLPDNY